jgi:hypothetical protein
MFHQWQFEPQQVGCVAKGFTRWAGTVIGHVEHGWTPPAGQGQAVQQAANDVVYMYPGEHLAGFVDQAALAGPQGRKGGAAWPVDRRQAEDLYG